MKFIVEGVTNSAPADTTLIRLLVRGQKIAKRMFNVRVELSAAVRDTRTTESRLRVGRPPPPGRARQARPQAWR